MKAVSIWAANAQQELNTAEKINLGSEENRLCAQLINDSLWLKSTWADGSKIAFRTAFSPSGKLEIKKISKNESITHIELECSTITFKVAIELQQDETKDVELHYTVAATPKFPLYIPFWPKDILPLAKGGTIKQNGTILTNQVGTRSGILYFNDGISGSVFYFQNLSALTSYNQDTETSAGALVGGEWPEIGFNLPPSKKPLEQGKTYILSDAFVTLKSEVPKDTSEISKNYLNLLAETYLKIPRPERHYHNWLQTVEKGFDDLTYHKGCWTFADGHSYLNAYVADYKNPPEVMVQLAVLLPMLEYLDWKGERTHQLVTELSEGLCGFYEKDMGTIVRYLPAVEQDLDNSEEQKKPRVMDSWYLHHPLMNLARLTQRGDIVAKKLLLSSINYVMKVAKHFDYSWPVFYQMDTLKTLKAETQPGEGGEKDVPGTYADLMLRMYDITGETHYLTEAKKATRELDELGFDIFYQANNTAFSATAMLRLYKITKDERYLNLSYDCLAGIFNNMQLWECDYGFGKHYSTFFGIFPLKDAPYTAAYEEQEVYAALHDYLIQAKNIEILPSIKLLIAEFIRHMVGRVAYYYPPLLPTEMINKNTKTGEIDTSLWVAIEDLHDGWEQSGEVGQEVYGAGIAFGVIPKQYHKIKGEDFILFCDYPTESLKIKGKSISLKTGGDSRLECRMIILKDKKSAAYHFTAQLKGKTEQVKPIKNNKEFAEFSIPGNQQVQIRW